MNECLSPHVQDTKAQIKKIRRYNFIAFFSLEIIMSYSILGYIQIEPISITLVPIIVVQGALYLGIKESVFLGLIFGLTSMWKANTAPLSYTDQLFSPALSGKPLESIILSIGTRVAFGLIAGILVWFMKKRRPYQWYDLFIVTNISFTIHAGLIFACIGIFFPSSVGTATDFSAQQLFLSILFGYLIPSIFINVMDKIFHLTYVQNLFEESRKVFYLRLHRKIDRGRFKYVEIALLIVTVFILIHAYQRIQNVFRSQEIEVSIHIWNGITQVLLQLFLAIIAIFYLIFIFMILAFEFSEVRRQENMKLSKALEENEKYRQQVEQALEEARRASEAKTQFLSRMSHDIRTPLNAIIGYSAIGMEESQGEKNEPASYEKIWKSGNYLLGLINDILDLSKIESDAVEFNLEPLVVSNCIDDMYMILKEQINERKLYFSYCSRGLQNQPVLLDSMRFQQIIMNLLSNAIKYSREGGIIEVESNLEELENEMIRIECKVRDSGIGMSAKFMKVMYEPYRQEEAKNESKGSGLGLAIVKNLVELMHGTLSVRSKVNEGTEFTITIDAQKAKLQTKENKDMDMRESTLTGKRVLLVEDNDINIDVSTIILRKKGILVEVAQNGAIAVEAFEQHEPGYYDAILMDIYMPVLDGNKATAKIRTLDRDDAKKIPIIAMTANALEGEVREAFSVGMTAYLTKPIRPEKLYATLQQWI